MAAIEKARDIREELVQANPKVLEFRRDLGQSYDNLAVYHAKAGHFEESFSCYRKSSEICEQLARDNPNNSNLQADLAINYRRLAGCHNRQGVKEETQKAKNWSEKSRAILERLAKNEPSVIRFQGELGLCCSDLGTTCGKLEQPAEALRAFQQTRGIFDKMVAANPAVMGYRRELAKSHLPSWHLLCRRS